MREIVLDTETTGLNYRGDDRIIEIGCVEVINHVATNNTLQFYCQADKEVSPEAQKVSGISSEFLKDKKTFSEQHMMFFDFIKDDQTMLEKEPLEKLTKTGQLMAFEHKGFWKCMDTMRDKILLNKLWKEDDALWKK